MHLKNKWWYLTIENIIIGEKIITYWPPPVSLEGKARRTKQRHVFQTWGRKSEKNDPSDYNTYLSMQKIFMFGNCETCPLWWFHIIVIQVETWATQSSVSKVMFRINGFMQIHLYSTSLNWNSSLRRQVSVNSSSLSPLSCEFPIIYFMSFSFSLFWIHITVAVGGDLKSSPPSPLHPCAAPLCEGKAASGVWMLSLLASQSSGGARQD